MIDSKRTMGDIAGDIDQLIKKETGVSVPLLANLVAPEVKRLNDKIDHEIEKFTKTLTDKP